LRSSEYKNSVS